MLLEQLIRFGVVHCHSENSMKDSPMSVEELCKRASELGAPAVALTDHGVLSGIFEFVRAAKKYGIKAIPGVEAYMQEDGALKRSHLILLAKDFVGYQAICRAVTKSNTRLDGDIPRMNMAILAEFFGEGAKGHGHVVATSACVGGVLAAILLHNEDIREAMNKLLKKQEKYQNQDSPVYQGNLALIEAKEKELEELRNKRDATKAVADKKFGQWQRRISKLEGAEYEAEKARLDAEKAVSERAKEELAEIKREITAISRSMTQLRQDCKDVEADVSRWESLQSQIDKLEATMLSPGEIGARLDDTVTEYRKIFGNDFYIELQYHGIPEEKIVMPRLAEYAKKNGIHTVAANDAHFATNSADDVRRRALVQALRFNKWMPSRPDDKEYYIKTDAELRDWLGRILDAETVENALSGIAEIVSKCDVVFPSETHFPKFVGEDAKARLRRLTEEGIKNKYGAVFPYRDRVEYELSVIEKMNYTDYLCIVQDYIRHCKEIGTDNPEHVGYPIGPGRGSAAGSLVCYLIGITAVDPMRYGLIFERFLNPDRISSPDIDVDFSNAVRDEALRYVQKTYGEEAVCCIMTKGTLAAKAAIKAAARIMESEQEVDGKSGKTCYQMGNDLAAVIPMTPGIKLSDCESDLRNAFPGNKTAKRIIDDAQLLEGVAINYGMHAAGVIIADNGDVGEYIPLMWNKANGVWMTQCDMVESEMQAGLLKFDFLGLKNLDIITEALRLIKRNTGKTIDIEKVPEEPAVFREVFAKGNTDFVFQFESPGMKNLLRRFKPSSMEHLTLLNAVFRPGPLQYIDNIIDVKSGSKKPTYVCDKAEKILSATYGCAVYQEQVMQLCNQVAGFSLGESDLIRRYMSKKKEDKMAEYRPKFIQGLIDNGAEPDAAVRFWDELMAFARYGFNKSHAAAYATVAYYTAWLKHHYPTEYMCAVMNATEIARLPEMVAECKRLGVTLLPPNVNTSGSTFTCRRHGNTEKNKGEILFGLGNIKHVGSGADAILKERENGTYRHFRDFLARVSPKKDVCEALVDAGALDHWCENRAALKASFPTLLSDMAKLEKARLALDGCEEKKKEANQKKVDLYKQRIAEFVLPVSMPEDNAERLRKEKELVGMYFSGHPLDNYKISSSGITSISDASNAGEFYSIAGLVANLNIKQRKSDKSNMAFFTLEDRSGEIEVCCFTEAFSEYGILLAEDACLEIRGRIQYEARGEDEERKKIIVSKIQAVEKDRKRLLLVVDSIVDFTDEIYPTLVPYIDPNGMSVMIYDKLFNELHDEKHVDFRLSPDVLSSSVGWMFTER